MVPICSQLPTEMPLLPNKTLFCPSFLAQISPHLLMFSALKHCLTAEASVCSSAPVLCYLMWFREMELPTRILIPKWSRIVPVTPHSGLHEHEDLACFSVFKAKSQNPRLDFSNSELSVSSNDVSFCWPHGCWHLSVFCKEKGWLCALWPGPGSILISRDKSENQISHKQNLKEIIPGARSRYLAILCARNSLFCRTGAAFQPVAWHIQRVRISRVALLRLDAWYTQGTTTTVSEVQVRRQSVAN